MTGPQINRTQSAQASVRFGLTVVFVVVLTMAVLVMPVSALWRAVILGPLLVFVLAFSWHQQLINWELHAQRRTIAALFVLGTILLAKASVSQLVQGIDLAGRLSGLTSPSNSISVELLLGFAASPWQYDIAAAALGLIALLAVLLFLKPPVTVSLDHVRQSSSPGKLQSPHVRYAAIDTYDSDLPPLVESWVGREQELEVLNGFSSGVITITGIGGQGKSALAATFLKNLREQSNLFWDWRDCREQADRFRLQLMSVIQQATNGEVTPTHLSGSDIGWLSRFFFKKCGNINGVIVFDNVDHYVDVDQSLFASTVSAFVNEALRVDHNLLIILTCRPRISYPSVRFREIYLRGLELSEALTLFDKKIPGGLKRDNRDTVVRIHELTRGHPLWLTIIAAHIARNPQSVSPIVNNLEAGNIDVRSRSMLQSIWNALHDRQKKILISMAELPRALEADHIYEYLGGSVGTHNRFSRAFGNLRAISLVTEKTAGGDQVSRFELHPMVRAFVRTGYRSRSERQEHLVSLLDCCEVIVARLSDQNGNNVSIALLEHLTTKAELQLAMRQFNACAITLNATYDQMVVNGVADEFVRISLVVLDSVDWSDEVSLDDEPLDSLMKKLAKIMVEMGMLDRLTPYLNRYTALLTQGTARHIGLCDIRTYVAWFSGNYSEAIKWGELGERQKKKSGLDTERDTSHNLALARRDSGDILRALEHFSGGLPITAICNEDHRKSQRDPSFYGNIGRCLALQGNCKNALSLYAKSYDLLQVSRTSQRQQLNLGYAAYWIAEALDSIAREQEACKFYEHASEIWRKRAPIMAEVPDMKLSQIEGYRRNSTPEALSDWCRSWVVKQLGSEIGVHG